MNGYIISQSAPFSIANNFHHSKAALNRKLSFLVNGKGVILHHDNVRPHTARLTTYFVEEIVWGNLSPFDYHLFKLLENHLDGLRLTSRYEIVLVSYFIAKPKEFYKHSIGKNKIVDRWNGGYTVLVFSLVYTIK